MFNFVFRVVILFILFILYRDVLKPYLDARTETKTILQTANIPFHKRATDQYRQQAMALLNSQCKNGFYELSQYEFRCASGSVFAFIDELL